MKVRIWACALTIVASGCSTQLEIQIVGRPDWQPRAVLPADCALTVYEITEVPDRECTEIGDVFVGDTGSTTDCGLERVIDTVRSEACNYGADAAQIVAHHEPSFFGSTCHQVRARFLSCKADEEDDG